MKNRAFHKIKKIYINFVTFTQKQKQKQKQKKTTIHSHDHVFFKKKIKLVGVEVWEGAIMWTNKIDPNNNILLIEN